MNQNKNFVFSRSSYAYKHVNKQKKALVQLRERIRGYASAIIFLQERLGRFATAFDAEISIEQSEYEDVIACVVTLSEYLKRYYEKIHRPANLHSFMVSFPLPLLVALKKANRQTTYVSHLLNEHYLANEADLNSFMQLQRLQNELEDLYIATKDVISQTRFLLHQTLFLEKGMSSIVIHC